MTAPFARTWILLPRREGVLEIEEVRDVTVPFLGRLGKVNRLRELSQRLDHLVRDLRNIHGRRLLELEDGNAGIDQLLKRRRDVLEANRLMTDVERHAEMPAERHVRF